jgi:FlaA1/EpsC-like NDP-sugar epimerase
LLLGVYRGRAARASFDELVLLVAAVMLMTACLTGCIALLRVGPPPMRVAAIVAPVAGSIMLAARLVWRMHHERLLRRQHGGARRTIVFGAGVAGTQVVRQLLRDPAAPFLPVSLLDDAPCKRNLRVMGVPVMGTREAMARVARGVRAEVLLVAIPSAGGSVLGELRELGRDAGLDVKVLPSLHELTSGLAKVGDIRDVQISDVLGRPPSLMDLTEMAGYLRGKRVMVTGAGGSIGSELSRVLSRFDPDEIIMLDRDESALHAVQLSIEGRALLDSSSIVLADIRDTSTLTRVFDEHRPHVVFHAAALKHLPLLERYPGEAVQSNVWGTLSVLAAAGGVERFVNISTDKAADPTSVLGWSKRVAERLVANGRDGTVCVSVRFGNVLGSRGSVLHTFAAQAQSGGPITVTHPDATRYFMTVTEAVHLVIAAGGIGKDGEALVLDMGEPARILEVARLVSADDPVPIEFTGLRSGEKLHEQLFGSGEIDERPTHPLISHVPVPPLDPRLAYSMHAWAPRQTVVKELIEMSELRVDGQWSTVRYPVVGVDSVPAQRSDPPRITV